MSQGHTARGSTQPLLGLQAVVGTATLSPCELLLRPQQHLRAQPASCAPLLPTSARGVGGWLLPFPKGTSYQRSSKSFHSVFIFLAGGFSE